MPTKKNVINDPDEEGQYWKYFRFHQLGVICLIIVIVIDWSTKKMVISGWVCRAGNIARCVALIMSSSRRVMCCCVLIVRHTVDAQVHAARDALVRKNTHRSLRVRLSLTGTTM